MGVQCVCVCACGPEAMESGDKELTEGRRDLGRGAKEVKEKRVCSPTHTHTPRRLILGDICSSPGHWQRALGWAQKYHHGNRIA